METLGRSISAEKLRAQK